MIILMLFIQRNLRLNSDTPKLANYLNLRLEFDEDGKLYTRLLWQAWWLWSPPPPGGYFGWPKITFERIFRYFRSIHNFYFWNVFSQNDPGGHIGWPKITFDRISRHFKSIHNYYFFKCYHKIAAGGHFGWPKITFDRISRYFRSICSFFFLNLFSKWPPVAILEVRIGDFWVTENHFRFAFLAISDQRATFFWRQRQGDGGATKNIIPQNFQNFGDIINNVSVKFHITCIYIVTYFFILVVYLMIPLK